MPAQPHEYEAKFLKPSELKSWHLDVIAECMNLSFAGDRDHLTARAWYQWYCDTIKSDPLHAEPNIIKQMERFHDEFAKTRLRGTK